MKKLMRFIKKGAQNRRINKLINSILLNSTEAHNTMAIRMHGLSKEAHGHELRRARWHGLQVGHNIYIASHFQFNRPDSAIIFLAKSPLDDIVDFTYLFHGKPEVSGEWVDYLELTLTEYVRHADNSEIHREASRLLEEFAKL